MNNVLIIAGHGNLDQSTANNALLAHLETRQPQLQVRRLSQLYPTGVIDVSAEQAALVEADIIVFQFPLNWYHLPARFKKWVDEVLAYGFAYGTGARLGGKTLVVSYTAAAPDECYDGPEATFIDKEHILDTFRATAKMCGMNFGGAIVENGYSPNPTGDPTLAATQQDKARAQADRLIALLESLR